MSDPIESQIIEAEERLRLAMLASDLASLDTLLSPELIFTTHYGTQLAKSDDLQIHRSGLLRLQSMQPSEQNIIPLGHIAYVSVRMHISGLFGDRPLDEEVRFSRVWQLSDRYGWQVIAGQATKISG